MKSTPDGQPDAPAYHAPPLGQRCVYFSNVTPETAVAFSALGPRYTALITADPNPAYHCSDIELSILRQGGGQIWSWCDGTSTPLAAAKLMAETRNLDGYSGQFEDDAQYDALVNSDASLGIGNPSALSPDRRTEATLLATHGSIAFIGEVMQPDPTYSAQGIPISSACFYLDRDQAQGGYLPLAAYSVMPESLRNACSIYTGAVMRAEDWALYAKWTRP